MTPGNVPEPDAGGDRRAARREARLRPEFAHRYPFLVPGTWDSAAVHADRVIANILGNPEGRFISGERALDPEHFEFRGSEAREAGGGAQRRDDQ